MEFVKKIKQHHNFADRVNFSYALKPLSREDTKEMVRYRLSKAGLKDSRTFFTEDALEIIHHHTAGYPRKITKLCHWALIGMVTRSMNVVNGDIVHDVIGKEVSLV
jgi:type II secretory pathway predicted ATPase ExeA